MPIIPQVSPNKKMEKIKSLRISVLLVKKSNNKNQTIRKRVT
jgi:hypothetical protein